MPNNAKVPTPTLERLATYFTILSELKSRQVETISSADVEERTGVNAAQFRKDLSYFGEFGRPGIGYQIDDLHARIGQILKLENTQPVILVGAGNLGSALVGYPALRADNFRIVAAFDNNYNKIGKQLWDLAIRDFAKIVEDNETLGARLAIIAVPAAAVAKTGFLYGSFTWLLTFLNINPKIAAAMLVVMSWPQLATALLGGLLAALTVKRLGWQRQGQ